MRLWAVLMLVACASRVIEAEVLVKQALPIACQWMDSRLRIAYSEDVAAFMDL